MKTLAVIFALCIVGAFSALTDEQKTRLREHREHCIDETKVDRELVNKAQKGEWTESDEKLRCFSSCLLKKIGSLDSDGNFKSDVTLDKMTLDVGADKAKEILKQCQGIDESDVCLKGMKLLKCYTDNKATLVVA